MDAQEAGIQLENRRRIIARANRLLYDESDRIKSLHTKMQLSDTLAEREAQVQLKDELNRLEQIREERFLEMDKHNYRKMLERELRERVELEDKQRECTKVGFALFPGHCPLPLPFLDRFSLWFMVWSEQLCFAM